MNDVRPNPPEIPGTDTSVDIGDVLFNTCRTTNPALYGVLVHEAGHVLGIRSVADGDSAHPYVAGATYSTMTTGHGIRCAPHPLDILAVYALYQSR